MGTRKSFAVIFSDEAYRRIVLSSSEAVFRCTKGRILTKCPQLCVDLQVTVNAAAYNDLLCEVKSKLDRKELGTHLKERYEGNKHK